MIVRPAVTLEPPPDAVIVAVVNVETAAVEIAKVALVAPEPTITLTGTAAAVVLLESVTVAPPAGAALTRVTVPVELPPPVTLDGDTVRFDTATCAPGVTVRIAETV